MRHFGPVLGFTLRDQEAAEAFLRGAQLVTDTTSFGGITTTAERRARWGGDAVAEGFIRMSVGLEDVSDLIADFGEALDGI
jgi:cystathionine gamma-lyase